MPNKALDLINAVGKTLQDLGFRQRSKEHPSDFTRNRKLGFVGVVSIIINGVRRTTQVENVLWHPSGNASALRLLSQEHRCGSV